MDTDHSRPDRPTAVQREDRIIVDIVEALAEADRLDVDEIEYTLYESINPAVLTELADDGGTWEFAFEVADHEVTVTSDGRLFVDGILCRTALGGRRSSPADR